VTLGEALTFIQQQVLSNSQLRGPQLALLEIAQLARQHAVQVPDLPPRKLTLFTASVNVT
jgi:hypothetical protein